LNVHYSRSEVALGVDLLGFWILDNFSRHASRIEKSAGIEGRLFLAPISGSRIPRTRDSLHDATD
jgi:hypothetical protein